MTGRRARTADAEANLYGILAEMLSFPCKELVDVVESGLLQMTVEAVARELPFEAGVPVEGLGRAGLSSTVLEAEYIRLFDLPNSVPTPLYTGVYAPRRRDAMEELLRMYRHFGLTVNGGSHDLPDFVPTVLEFLRFLFDGASHAVKAGREARERAAADVLERHLCPWAEETVRRLARRETLPFYRALIETVAAVASAQLRQLRSAYPAAGGQANGGYRPSR